MKTWYITCSGHVSPEGSLAIEPEAVEEFSVRVLDELLKVARDGAHVYDADTSAALSTGTVEFSMYVENEDPDEACRVAMEAVRRALAGARGDSTWTVDTVHVVDASVASLLDA